MLRDLTALARASLLRFTVALWMCFGLVACDHGTARPLLGEISSIELQPFVRATPSRVLDSYTTTRVAQEVNALRGENWREFRGKVGACSVVIKMFSGKAEVAKYYVTLEPMQLIELEGFKSHSGFILDRPNHMAPALVAAVSLTPVDADCRRR